MVTLFSPVNLIEKAYSSLRSKQMPYFAKTSANSVRCTANLEQTLCSSPVSAITAVQAEFKTANFSANSNQVAETS
jgi:hypothetical protein